MYKAVQAGLVQRMIGESALEWQRRVESGQEKIIGVNSYVSDDDSIDVKPYRPDPARCSDTSMRSAHSSPHAVSEL